MKYDDFNWDDIVLEAPGDEAEMDVEGGDDELGPTDYTETDDMEIEEGEPEEEPTAEEEPEGDEENPEDLESPETGEEGDLEAEGEGDENQEEEQIDNGDESDVSTDKQNKNLVNDFIELYRRIDEIMNQIRTDCKTNIRYNQNMIVVRKNLIKLKNTTYEYITKKFTKESYVTNLYQFNLIIQALNVNIDLLSSILASNKKMQEEQNSKKKKPDKKSKK